MAGWVAGVAAGFGPFLTEIRYGAVGLPCRLGGRSCLPVLSTFSLRSTAPQWIYPDGIGGRLLLSGDWHCYLDASDWMELVWAGLLLLGEQVVNRHEFIH